ncbi:MAG: helix-turn-helix transcriptional regulator [Chloroflexi bacterium]|nr:helix-turn-helix transcriptional regulator [Chloroflexota bacterium]
MDDRLTRRVAGLTDRQRRLLRLAAGGVGRPEIALRLGLSEAVVARELAALYRALGVQTRDDAALVWWGSREGSPSHLADVARDLLGDDLPGA